MSTESRMVMSKEYLAATEFKPTHQVSVMISCHLEGMGTYKMPARFDAMSCAPEYPDHYYNKHGETFTLGKDGVYRIEEIPNA